MKGRLAIQLSLALNLFAQSAFAFSGTGGDPVGMIKIFVVGIIVALIAYAGAVLALSHRSTIGGILFVLVVYIFVCLLQLALTPSVRPEHAAACLAVLRFIAVMVLMWLVRAVRHYLYLRRAARSTE